MCTATIIPCPPSCVHWAFSTYALSLSAPPVRWDPMKRITPEEAMQHEWIQAKTRPKTRPTRKPHEGQSSMVNVEHSSQKPATNRTGKYSRPLSYHPFIWLDMT